jgi:REP element-mobilizing transposase RayT
MPSRRRKSYIEIGKLCFWTATINTWHRLLWNDAYKDIIINSWDYLSNLGKIDVFGFVIMPTHLHSIWRINDSIGKRTVQGSFLSVIAHEFRKKLLAEEGNKLQKYHVTAKNKEHEFWQRDSLPIQLHNEESAFRVLRYFHNNPLAKHWRLAKEPSEYKYSSARFYETGIRDFSFLRDLRDVSWI